MRLECRDVAHQYGRNPKVLDGVNATFEPGVMTAITGASGKGKSTLLFVCGLLLKPTAGSIFLDGEPTQHMTDAIRSWQRSSKIGFVFQDACLDSSRSIIDNILEGAVYRNEGRRSRIDRAHHLLDEFGVQLPPKRKPGQISGGQAQRIALCRALLADPPLILGDEPTAGLDADNASLVILALQRMRSAGKTVVVASHDERIVGAADQVIQL